MPVDTLVLLQHADDRVAHLREGELLPDADTGSAVKGDVLYMYTLASARMDDVWR